MNEVLIVYKEVNCQNEQPSSPQDLPIITVSIDEKPGIQALRNVSADLPPVPGKDAHYERLGTLSLLAGLDLHTGHVIAQVHERHRSREFISLLQALDEFYPKDCIIRIILDNHSAHISKETMSYLATKPNRFIYVHTPTHGSWLNLVETLFAKWRELFSNIFGSIPKTNLANASCKASQKSMNHQWFIAGKSSILPSHSNVNTFMNLCTRFFMEEW
jgi:transposase